MTRTVDAAWRVLARLLGILQELIQVKRQDLKYEALVVAVHKVVQQPNYVALVVIIPFVDLVEDVDLRLGLHQEGLPGLDDLNCDLYLPLLVIGAHHLAEGTLAHAVLQDVALL